MPKSEYNPPASEIACNLVELVELIALNLNYHDIVRARDVSSFWRSVISNSPKLLRSMYKSPVLNEDDDEDPHFEQGSIASKNALIQHDVDAGKPVLQEAKHATMSFLQDLRPGLTKEELGQQKHRFHLLCLRIGKKKSSKCHKSIKGHSHQQSIGHIM